jgi:hypothetical protein
LVLHSATENALEVAAKIAGIHSRKTFRQRLLEMNMRHFNQNATSSDSKGELWIIFDNAIFILGIHIIILIVYIIHNLPHLRCFGVHT